MPVVYIIVILIVIGVGLWAINRYAAPYIYPPILKLINVVGIVGTIIWLIILLLGALNVDILHWRLGR